MSCARYLIVTYCVCIVCWLLLSESTNLHPSSKHKHFLYFSFILFYFVKWHIPSLNQIWKKLAKTFYWYLYLLSKEVLFLCLYLRREHNHHGTVSYYVLQLYYMYCLLTLVTIIIISSSSKLCLLCFPSCCWRRLARSWPSRQKGGLEMVLKRGVRVTTPLAKAVLSLHAPLWNRLRWIG